MKMRVAVRRFSLAVMLGAILCAPAQASARGDLKAGYDAMLRRDYEKAIALLTGAIESGDLSRAISRSPIIIVAPNISRSTGPTTR